MAVIKLNKFSGIQPRLHPALIEDGMATRANNCRLKNGQIVPLKQPKRITDNLILVGSLTSIGNAKSIYHWRRGEKSEFLAWAGLVKVAQSNLADDERFRIFVSGDTEVSGGQPVMFAGNTTDNGYVVRPLVKTPMAAPSLTVGTPSDENDIRYSVWFQTWVDEYGQESPTSDASEEIQYSDGDAVTIGMAIAPTYATLRRFYKVIAGSGSENDGGVDYNIQYVTEQKAVQGVFPSVSVSVKDDDCGEAIPDIKAPPDDLRDMQFVSGTFYCGFSPSSPKTVMFSNIDQPYSWPMGYRYDIRDEIVGLASVKNNVYALTKGFPALLTGYAPENMTVTDIASRQACVSARSIVAAEGSVFYASQDGICQINPDTDYQYHVNVLTDKFLTKEQWSALAPETCLMEEYDGALFAWFTPQGKESVALIFDMKESAAALSTHDEHATCAFYDCVDDALYYVKKVGE